MISGKDVGRLACAAALNSGRSGEFVPISTCLTFVFHAPQVVSLQEALLPAFQTSEKQRKVCPDRIEMIAVGLFKWRSLACSN
jgi:hypothetical protein